MIKNIGLNKGFIKIYPALLLLLGCFIISFGFYQGSKTVIEKEVTVEQKSPIVITKDIENYKQKLIIANDTVLLFIDVEFTETDVLLHYNFRNGSDNGYVITYNRPLKDLYKLYSDWALKNSKLVTN